MANNRLRALVPLTNDVCFAQQAAGQIDGATVYRWSAAPGQAVQAFSSSLDSLPTLAGAPVYAAVRLRPAVNGSTMQLGVSRNGKPFWVHGRSESQNV